MCKIVSGVFNGTGATLYLCIGFIPDKVILRNCEATTCLVAKWSKNSRSAEQIAGVLETQGVSSALAVGAGIAPYRGGDELTAAIQTSSSYGEGVYLGFDKKDYRGIDIASGGSVIDKWTLDTAGNRTGHFNEDVVGTYIGEGSVIVIDGKEYVIEAVTAGQGEAADEVTLNEAAPSGNIDRISGMYDLSPLALGGLTPAGFSVKSNTLNGNGELMMFEAFLYDN
ncbi:MAG: hypothetical protein WC551_12800 [Patescibacteria group bacterium]